MHRRRRPIITDGAIGRRAKRRVPQRGHRPTRSAARATTGPRSCNPAACAKGPSGPKARAHGLTGYRPARASPWTDCMVVPGRKACGLTARSRSARPRPGLLQARPKAGAALRITGRKCGGVVGDLALGIEAESPQQPDEGGLRGLVADSPAAAAFEPPQRPKTHLLAGPPTYAPRGVNDHLRAGAGEGLGAV